MGEVHVKFRNVDKLEGNWLKLVVLAANFLTSSVLTMISLSKHMKESGSDITDEAIASLGVFSAVGGLYSFFIVGTLVRQNTTSEHRRNVSIAIGGLFYYIGDNLPPLIREYPNELCVNDHECVELVEILGICMLGIATVTYIPVLVDVALPQNEEKESELVPTYKKEQTGSTLTKEQNDEIVQLLTRGKAAPEEKKAVHVVVLLLLAKMTNLDLVYTVIERASSNKCTDKVTGVAWAYFVVYFTAFIILCGHKFWSYKIEATPGSLSTQRNTCCCSHIWTTIVLSSLVSGFAALFILADTRLPLACSGIAETKATLDVIRLVLWLVAFIIACTLFGCWYCCIYKKSSTDSKHKRRQRRYSV